VETVSGKYSADFHYNISISNQAANQSFIRIGDQNDLFFGAFQHLLDDSNYPGVDYNCINGLGIDHIAAGNHLCRVNHSCAKHRCNK